MKRENKIFNMIITAVFAAIIAVGAITSLSVAAVPFTLQSFAVFLALGTIGWKRGTVSVGVYLLLGLVGAPIFAGFKSGAGVLFGPTGGFLIGFVFMGFAYGGISFLLKKTRLNGLWIKLISFSVSNVVLYVFGCLMFAVLYLKKLDAASFSAAFSACVIPFLIPDFIKIIAAALISHQLEKMKIMKKYGI